LRLELIVKPLTLAIIAVFILQYCGLDKWLAGNIYDYLGGWTLRESWFLQTVIHHGGRNLVFLIVALMIFACITSWVFFRSNLILIKILSYLTLSTTLSLLVVLGLKQITTLPCPWSLLSFGGGIVDIQLDQVFSSEMTQRHCFPAGHSSLGFALFSIYFAARIGRDSGVQKLQSQNLKRYLLPGLVLGAIFGLAQEIRGAHFLSHDITTAALCWLISGLLWILFFAPPKEIVKQNQNAKLVQGVWNKISAESTGN
jgi:membrane-associated PAP2 superfamily phosphatase